MVGVRQRQFWAKQKRRSATWTERLHLQGAPGQFSLLLYTTHQGQCQLVVCRAWWQSGFGCLIWDLIKISPLMSRNLYNLCWRPGLGSCPNSRLLSDFLGGRKFLPKRWLHLLPCLQGSWNCCSGMCSCCDILRLSPGGRRAWGMSIAPAEQRAEIPERMVQVGEVCLVQLEEGG